jgi:DNA-nicking Smr family endonuclease
VKKKPNRVEILDLHGASRYQAMQSLNDRLDECTDSRMLVITGRGRHSPGGVPVIKPMVEAFLNRNGYWRHWHESSGSGAVTLELGDPRR